MAFGGFCIVALNWQRSFTLTLNRLSPKVHSDTVLQAILSAQAPKMSRMVPSFYFFECSPFAVECSRWTATFVAFFWRRIHGFWYLYKATQDVISSRAESKGQTRWMVAQPHPELNIPELQIHSRRVQTRKIDMSWRRSGCCRSSSSKRGQLDVKAISSRVVNHERISSFFSRLSHLRDTGMFTSTTAHQDLDQEQ